jgi:AcrR family transcriptional regulator
MPRFKSTDRNLALDQTRLRLLDAAAEEFSGVGFDRANINSISIAAGYAKGTIYNYFPSKSALLLAVIDWVAETHLKFIKDKVLTEQDSSQRLASFFLSGFDFVYQHYTQARSMFNVAYGPDEAQKDYIFQAYQPLIRFVAQEIILFGIERGSFRAVDPSSTALLLMTIYLGTASQTTPQHQSFFEPKQVTTMILQGLAR